MSDQYKQENVKKAQSLVTELEKQLAEAIGKKEAAEQAAQQWQGEIDALNSNLTRARDALEQVQEAV
jgi:hypothetical protein